MQNPKTTWGGIILIIAGLATLVGHFLMSGALNMTDLQAVIAAIVGVVGGGALVGAKDGGA